MQVKKFEAPTIAEAIKLVKTELGPEAIILSTKNHRKGFGLLSKASVEVTAAVADKSLAKKQITEKVVPEPTKQRIGKLPASKQAEVYNEFSDHYTRRYRQKEQRRSAYDEREEAARHNAAQESSTSGTSGSRRYIDITDDDSTTPASTSAYGRNGRMSFEGRNADTQAERLERSSSYSTPQRSMASTPSVAVSAPATTQNGMDVAALQEDVQRLKLMLEELKTEQTTLTDARIPETSTDELHVEYQNLLRNGIDKRYATALIKQVSFSLPREALCDSGRIVEALAVEMMNGLKISHPLDIRSGSERRVYAMVGPTGVGKTTTIAKLASQAILQKNLRVGLINVDSYKVAALDQLATYAKILNVPFRQASTPVELDRALAEFKPLDLVLIDTSGRSQRDSESLSQMKTLLSECAAIRPLLIMSATTRDQELYDIITRFKIFNPTGLVFSKLDETSTFGCIFNIASKTKLPLTYFTVGQRVPEDIEPASGERVADLILDL